MAISRLGFNITSNIQDRQRSGQLFFDVLILFCREDFVQSLGTLPWEIIKYLIDGRTF